MVRTVGSDGARTEEAIRTAAIELIAARGFAAVSLRDIASKVGVQAGSLYRYFPNKSELLLTIMVEHMEDVLAHWRSEKPQMADPKIRLNAFIEFHVRYHARKQKEVFIGNMEMRNLAPEHYDIVAGLRDEYEQELRSILQEGADSGQLKVPDIQVATFAILAMLTGLTGWYREDGRLSKDDLVKCYIDLATKGVDG